MPTACRSISRRPFRGIARADRFLQTAQEDEPFDRIRFDGGQVDPGQYLRLDFDLVDVNGTTVFYLVQRPITLLAWDSRPPCRSRPRWAHGCPRLGRRYPLSPAGDWNKGPARRRVAAGRH